MPGLGPLRLPVGVKLTVIRQPSICGEALADRVGGQLLVWVYWPETPILGLKNPRSEVFLFLSERLWTAARRGAPLPPVSVVRVGEGYFVGEGRDRLSVARALGSATIKAEVVELGRPRLAVGRERA